MDVDKKANEIPILIDEVNSIYEDTDDVACATVFFSPFAGFSLLLATIKQFSLQKSLTMTQLQKICITLLDRKQQSLCEEDSLFKSMLPERPGDAIINDWPSPSLATLKTHSARLNEIFANQNNDIYDEQRSARIWGAYIVHSFAHRLRGLENSSVEYIVKQFLRKPGCVRIDRKKITVKLEPIHLGVVLQMAGLLGWQGRIPWLDNKDLIIELAS